MYNILESSRFPNKREILIFFDLVKAIGSIRHSLLFTVLRNKAQSIKEKHLVELIILTFTEMQVHIGEEKIKTNKGVP